MRRLVPDILHQHQVSHLRRLVSQECKRHHTNDQHRTGKPKLRAGLSRHVDGKHVEMQISRCVVHAVVLADSENTAVGEHTRR
jgi:hypothetical protein